MTKWRHTEGRASWSTTASSNNWSDAHFKYTVMDHVIDWRSAFSVIDDLWDDREDLMRMFCAVGRSRFGSADDLLSSQSHLFYFIMQNSLMNANASFFLYPFFRKTVFIYVYLVREKSWTLSQFFVCSWCSFEKCTKVHQALSHFHPDKYVRFFYYYNYTWH